MTRKTDIEQARTERALLVLANDVAQFVETAERVRLQFNALAQRYGVATVPQAQV